MTRPTKKVGEPSLYHSKITDWPLDERPREKLMHRGAAALSDAELLAILIRAGTGRITAVDLAKTLLKDFRSVEHLATRAVQDFRQYKGLGEVKAISLIAAFELGRRAASARGSEKMQINSPEDVVRVYQPLLRDLQQEVFKVLLLDSANHLLRDVTITTGLLNSSLVHPREVFRAAILEPAASIILLHNHPSGNPDPSSEDIQITRQLVEASKVVGIPIHDHLIIALEKFTSFAERGLLS
ncbi:MAG: DNA repair protein RadC [Ignavibacteriae bacterium]|nr:DNA repair protein RadC [Ignavibacteria bacterium]MBI3364173.1 DNA repair protein RadC [Ignavibacteriota bacterium]